MYIYNCQSNVLPINDYCESNWLYYKNNYLAFWKNQIEKLMVLMNTNKVLDNFRGNILFQ